MDRGHDHMCCLRLCCSTHLYLWQHSLRSVSADAVMVPSGGMLPLSATLATNSIFEAFQDDSKLKALLHGHSYTAHAIGCSAAVTALDMYTDPACNPNLHEADQQKASPCLVGVWDEQTVDRLSRHARVQQLVVLGRPANLIRNAVCNVKHRPCNAIWVLSCITAASDS